MASVPVVIALFVTAAVLTAGIYDIRFRRIPNWLTLSCVVVGLGLNVVFLDTPGLIFALKGLGLGFALYLPLYAIRAMGAGDVKLMAGVGAALGPGNCLLVFSVTAVLGGISAMVLIVVTGRFRKTISNVVFLIKSLAFLRAPYMSREELDVHSEKAVGLPHGAVIALATLGVQSAIFWYR